MYLDSMGSIWWAYFALLQRLGASAWPLSVTQFFSSFALHGVYLAIERGLWPPRDHVYLTGR